MFSLCHILEPVVNSMMWLPGTQTCQHRIGLAAAATPRLLVPTLDRDQMNRCTLSFQEVDDTSILHRRTCAGSIDCVNVAEDIAVAFDAPP